MKGNFLNKIDFYSGHYNFIFNGLYKLNSPIGGIFSIMTLIIICIFIFFQFIEYFNNPNRRLKYQVQISSVTDEIILSSSIALHFGNIFGESLVDYENYFSFNASFITRTRGTDNILLTNQNPVNLRKCESNDFKDYEYLSESSLNIKINQSICFENLNNLKLSASLKENINSYIKLSIDQCVNSTLNNNSCYPSEKIQTLITKYRIFLSIYYLDNLITNSDDLVTKDLRKDFFLMDKTKYQIIEYHISPSILYYSNSLLSDKDCNLKFNKVDKLNHHSFNIQSNSTTLLNLYFFPSNKKGVFYLLTSSFLNYISHIGGFIKIITLLFEAFILRLNRRKSEETILKVLYNLKRTQLNKTLLTSMGTNKTEAKIEKNGDLTQPKIKLRLKLNINDNKIHQVSAEDNVNQPNNKTDFINFNTSNNILMINNNDLKVNKKPFEFTMDDIHLTKLEEKEVTNVIKYIFQRNNTSSEIGQLNNTLFTTWENMKILFCYCFIFKQLRSRNDVFKRLIINSIKYLDSINIIKTVCEFEKLKFVFFDDKQLSLFNVLSKPRNPLEVLENEIKFSTFNNETPFTYEKANAFLFELKSRKNLSRVDKKLLELVNK